MILSEFMRDNILYLDGGMGTLLQSAGLLAGEYPERWNLINPDVIAGIHKDYYDAGSNIVSTNTFGANSLKFSDIELDEIVGGAVRLARRAAAESSGKQPKFVALDIGPTGKLLKPYGDLDFEDAVEIFAKTVRLGVKYGVDLIFIETMNDSYETKAALLAAKENSDLPVFVSNAYSEDGKLMTGADPKAMIAMLEGMGADAIGVNCSLGPQALAPVVEQYLKYASVPVLMKPNAGLPKIVDGKTVYDVEPADFAATVKLLMDKGLRIAGGCCGTTPSHIYELTKQTKDVVPTEITDKNITWVSSYTHAVEFADEPVLVGERINPTGKKRFKQALAENDIEYILNEGIRQQEKGVHILDVNVGLPEIDEAKMLTNAVVELQAVTDLPLQIDTSDPVAMEKALRRYNGKAMINSVSGKREVLESILPLVKKYGGVVVALTLDDSGIPDTAEGRVAIAKRILAAAESYGISKKDIVFDTLAMTVSASGDAANVTVGAMREIKHGLGCHTSLGVSNISFGLPGRELINGTFFAIALTNGLSAAIMNPDSPEMMKTYYAYRALAGLDANCVDYIGFASSYVPAVSVSASAAAPAAVAEVQGSDLHNAVIKGLKEKAAAAADVLLNTCSPMDVVQNEIIPALNVVGKGFEEKRVYLPQLLMSAEAAAAAFERVKVALTAGDTASDAKCPIVIATVKGDIHDIGKNIVKLLLENYGFAVTDLGRDVAPEAVLDAVCELHAPMAALSALMTTTVPAMEDTVRLLREKAPWCKIIVGGAVLTQEYADKMGADKYAKDAMEAVRYAENVASSL